MTKSKESSAKSSRKKVKQKVTPEEYPKEDQRPGFPDIDFKKTLGCG